MEARQERGVLYVALGADFLAMALQSAATLRRTSPTLGIAVVTNVSPRTSDEFDWTRATVDVWEFLDVASTENRSVKLEMYERSPFLRTLYLDADTSVLSDIEPMFAWLDHHDLALHLQPRGARPRVADILLADGLRLGDVPHWNSGVVLFRRGADAQEFFATWQAEFRRLGVPFDQAALAATMLRSSARVLTFDARWNSPTTTLTKYDWSHLGGVRIHHYMHGMPLETLEECLRYASLIQQSLQKVDGGPPDERVEVALRSRITPVPARQRCAWVGGRFLDRLRRGAVIDPTPIPRGGTAPFLLRSGPFRGP